MKHALLEISFILLPATVLLCNGFLFGWLLTKDKLVASGFAAVFLVYLWSFYGLIGIQAWGQQDFGFYFQWILVVFGPSHLLVGLFGSAITEARIRKAGFETGWGRAATVLLTGMGGFLVGTLLCALIGADLFAARWTDHALAVAFFGPQGFGLVVLWLVLRGASLREGSGQSPDAEFRE